MLTKTDLIRDAASLHDLSLLRERLGRLSPSARITTRDEVPRLTSLLDAADYDLGDRPEDVIGWLALERATDSGTPAHAHDPNRHGESIRAVPFLESEPLDPGHFNAFVDLMMLQTGILRLKGLVALSDDPSRPMLVHGVQHVLHEKKRLEGWPSDDRRSRIVVLGDGLPSEATQRLFSATVRRPLINRLVGAFR